MNITKVITLAKVGDPNQGFHVLVEDVGWLHIAKWPPSRDNIFFSKEEIEMLTGEQLFVKSEQDVAELDDAHKEAIKRWCEL